jgi:hypothetical protein
MRPGGQGLNNMKRFWLLVLLISLSGCSKVRDLWTCSVMSGHKNVVAEAKIEIRVRTLAKKMALLAKKEDMLFGAKDVLIDYPGHRYVRKEIEICNRDVQILADNFRDGDIFVVYVRSSRNKIDANSMQLFQQLLKN